MMPDDDGLELVSMEIFTKQAMHERKALIPGAVLAVCTLRSGAQQEICFTTLQRCAQWIEDMHPEHVSIVAGASKSEEALHGALQSSAHIGALH